MIEWKAIEGFESYEVSNAGQVRSLNYKRTGETKILKPRKQGEGYLLVNLWKNGKQYTKTVHRLVAKTFIPNLENKPQVNHIDGNKQNNAVSNLEWCTSLENIQHSWNTGLSKMTEDRKKKLSESHKGKYHTQETKNKMSESHKKQVICVTTRETFDYMGEAAKKYNVNQSSISKCCKGKHKSAGKHPVTGEKLVWKYMDI